MRPSKLETEPDLQQRIVKRIEDGNYPEVAAQAEGVSPPTYYRWMQQGADEDAEPVYREFREAIERARARVEAEMVAEIRRNIDDKGNVTTVDRRWLLERTRRERYGQSIEVRVREEARDDLLHRLHAKLDPAVFEVVLGALMEDGGDEVPEEDDARH